MTPVLTHKQWNPWLRGLWMWSILGNLVITICYSNFRFTFYLYHVHVLKTGPVLVIPAYFPLCSDAICKLFRCTGRITRSLDAPFSENRHPTHYTPLPTNSQAGVIARSHGRFMPHLLLDNLNSKICDTFTRVTHCWTGLERPTYQYILLVMASTAEEVVPCQYGSRWLAPPSISGVTC